MELNRKMIKVLAVDTRVDILKSLGKRRKSASEIAKELNLANSTISEHLDKLGDAGLIKRVETGHKWIYYDLTEKGRELIYPNKAPFMVLLSLGIVLIVAGSYLFASPQFDLKYLYSTAGAQETTSDALTTLTTPAPDYSFYVISAGIILIILSMIKFGLDRRKSKVIYTLRH